MNSKTLNTFFMKRFILSLVLVASIGATSFAADDTMVSTNVRQSFQKSFSNAKEVNWSLTSEIYKADFVYNSQYLAAYYDAEGTLLGVTKNILSTQLPLLLESSLKENYSGYWISDVIEFSNEDGTTYYVTLENGDGKLVLKSSQTT